MYLSALASLVLLASSIATANPFPNDNKKPKKHNSGLSKNQKFKLDAGTCPNNLNILPQNNWNAGNGLCGRAYASKIEVDSQVCIDSLTGCNVLACVSAAATCVAACATAGSQGALDPIADLACLAAIGSFSASCADCDPRKV